MSTFSIFDAAREMPDGVALIDRGHTLSFREAAERAAPLAAALLANRPRVLALTPRADTQSLLWLYAALATGTPVLTLHQRAARAERRAAMLLVDASECPRPSPALEAFEPADLPRVSPDAPLAFIPTSGSTGTPRLVELSRAALLASATASAGNLGWEADDLWLLCLPLAHAGGLSIVTRCLLARRGVLLFEPGTAGLAAQSERLVALARRATLISVVPSVLTTLLDAGFTGSAPLRAVLVGGAACSPALARRAHDAGLPLLTSYGSTETASQVVTRRYAERFDPPAERDGIVSSGHPLKGVELRVEAGVLAVRTASLLTRYHGSERAPLDADGWLRTRDRCELGPSGELYVRGRLDDVIVSGGENVDPLEVEAALATLPGISAVCVVGTPSATFGEVVSAAIVTRDPALTQVKHLADLLADRLARYKLPRRTVRAELLPLTASGKVDRRAVRDLFASADEDSRSS